VRGVREHSNLPAFQQVPGKQGICWRKNTVQTPRTKIYSKEKNRENEKREYLSKENIKNLSTEKKKEKDKI
jgi:hypothetical protein